MFGDNGRGKVRGLGIVRVSDRFTLREVTLVSNLGFNLLSVSQFLDEGFEVRFKEGCSRVLDSRGDLVCRICLLYTSPSPRDGLLSRMPSSA